MVDAEDPEAEDEDEGQVEEDPAEFPAEDGEDLAAEADTESGPVDTTFSLVVVQHDGAAGDGPVEDSDEDDDPTGLGCRVDELIEHLHV